MKITKQDLIDMNCDPEHVDDWFDIRKDKRAPSLTGTAWKKIVNQIELAGLTIAQGIEACCEYEWRGFRADWYANKLRQLASESSNIHLIDDAKSRKEGVRTALRNINGTDW